MSIVASPHVPDLIGSDQYPVLPGMDEAWQAHLFALTVHLNERGLFTWSRWADYFGPALKASYPALEGEESGTARAVNRHYFMAWQYALEQLLCDLEIALPLDIGLRAQAQGCYPRLARAPMVFRALAQAPGKTGPS